MCIYASQCKWKPVILWEHLNLMMLLIVVQQSLLAHRHSGLVWYDSVCWFVNVGSFCCKWFVRELEDCGSLWSCSRLANYFLRKITVLLSLPGIF